MRQALRWVPGWLGVPDGPQGRRPSRRPVSQSEAAQRPASADPAAREGGSPWSRDLARRLWQEAMPAARTPVERYLATRGLALPDDPDALRFHPAAWRNRDRGPPGPAMLALMTTPAADPATGFPRPCGVHVTYLRPDGSGKAEGERTKVMLGAVGVIRLVPEEEVTHGLGLAEGIETSLAIMQGFGWRPVWAATSAGAISAFPVLDGIGALTVFADMDDRGAGRDAAQRCAARWRAAGREARIFAAPAGEDFNDTLKRRAA